MPQRRRFLWKNPKDPKSHEITVTETTEEGKNIASDDIISNLPIEIIRKILFWVPPKDVARTSILSKGWRSIWASLPDIYLDEMAFGANYFTCHLFQDPSKRNAFLTYLKKFLDDATGDNIGHEVGMFFLGVTALDESAEILVKSVINFASRIKAQTVHLALKDGYDMPYYFRGMLFCCTSLLVLTIQDAQISSCYFMLPNLKSLFLYNVTMDTDVVFSSFMYGFPGVEELIIEPYPLEQHIIEVPNQTLKFVKVKLTYCRGKLLQIESKNLESLEFTNLMVGMGQCKVEISSTNTVKNLTLQNVYVGERTLTPFINRFSLLENLVIDGCHCGSPSADHASISNNFPRLFFSQESGKLCAEIR